MLHLLYSLLRYAGSILALSVFMLQSVLAQGSTIKGRVVDATTGSSLPGANVVLVNTGVGTSTDLDGNYVLHRVPLGPWTLRVSYVGYRTITENVMVHENVTIERNFRLVPQTLEGEVVIVTAQAQGQMQAINQQLASNRIVSIVSEARIQELPDFNAAQAISRLPGVSMLESSGEANKVVIRGLAPEYNAVSISGINLASTGSTQIGAASQGGTAGTVSTDRSTDLTMVTPYMIKTIEVFKSLTPDMNANAIGGVVNMELREAPSGIRTDLLSQLGYTQKSGKYGNYRVIGSASGRFFDDAFGAYLLVNAEQYDRDADNMNAGYTTGLLLRDPVTGYNRVQVTSVRLNRHLETRNRYGANLILDYRYPSGLIRSLNMFSRLNSEFNDHDVILDYRNNNLDFRFRSGKGTTDIGVHSLEFENDFGFISTGLKAAYTYSRNRLPESPFFQFRQTGSVATGGAVAYDVPPESLIAQVSYRGPEETNLLSLSLLSTDYKETGKLIKGDFKIPFTLGTAVSGFLKFGGEYRQNHHLNDQSTPYADFTRRINDTLEVYFPVQYNRTTNRFPASNFTSGDSKLLKSFLGDRFGSIYWAANPSVLTDMTYFIRSKPDFNAKLSTATNPEGWHDGLFQHLPNDYDYTENYAAAYAMAQVSISPAVMLVGGIRLEDVTSEFFAYNLKDGRNPATQEAVQVEAYPSNRFWLPMVQLKIDPVRWANIRLAYTQTLARPAYHQLSPHFDVNFARNSVWAGNPDLRPAQSYNHDLVLTFHGNELGLLSIGGFYKEVKNFTYYTQYKLRSNPRPGLRSPADFEILGVFPLEGATLNTWINNQYIAYVRGIEFDYQTRFWYLPFPFDGLLLGFNYTRISSSATYPLRDEITYGVPGRPGFRVEQIDSTRQGRLIFQPNDIANAFIGYEHRGFSARISFVFQGNSVSGVGAFPEQDGFTDDYFRTDIAVRQDLPWRGLQLFLDVTNVNNRTNVSRQISIRGFTNEKHYGMVANLGVRFRL